MVGVQGFNEDELKNRMHNKGVIIIIEGKMVRVKGFNKDKSQYRMDTKEKIFKSVLEMPKSEELRESSTEKLNNFGVS